MKDSKMTLAVLVSCVLIVAYVALMPRDQVPSVADTWKEAAIYQCKAVGSCI